MFDLWMAFRILKNKKSLSLSTILAVIGLAIGVASLFTSMVIITSYFGALKKTVIDIYGDVSLLSSYRQNPEGADLGQLPDSLKKQIVASTGYYKVTAVAIQNKKMEATVIHGFNGDTVLKVLDLQSRLVEGEKPFSKKYSGENPPIWVGHRLAKRLKLKVGDLLNIVVPIHKSYGLESFRPKLKKFVVKGLMSFGRYDYDTKYLVTEAEPLRKFAELTPVHKGYRIKITDSENAESFARQLNKKEELGFYATHWKAFNINLFEAAEYEKNIIFFILLIIVIVACFNVASTLFVSVVRKFKAIATLKALGMTGKQLRRVFIYKGLLIGLLGYVLGISLGYGICQGFVYAQKNWNILNSEIYKVEELIVSLEFFDLFSVGVASLFLCFLATLVPAIRGGRLKPMEGFRHE